MITLSSAQLAAWLAAFMWPFARVLGLLIAAPIFGNPRFPLRVRLALALIITVVVAPTLPPLPQVAPDSLPGLGIFAQQLLIGLTMGFALRLIFTAVEMAGELIGLQMGLGFAVFYDPQNAGQMPLIGQFLGVLTTLIFLAVNGHLLMLSALAESFRDLPIGDLPGQGTWLAVAGWGSRIFAAALLLAMPVVAALLTVNLALAALTRAAPQLNVFAIGFPITLAVGFSALLLTLPWLTPVVDGMLRETMEALLILRR
ncbi:MAG: flagellar biosynthetic protein FliR [Burkholderiales bacterium]|nr:flagellar biosynthetic protein FliR [Burkholderiales bacterium]